MAAFSPALPSPRHPRLNLIVAIFAFPHFQRFIAAGFWLDHLAVMRVLIHLNRPSFAGNLATADVALRLLAWGSNVHDIAQVEVLFAQQVAQLGFEFDVLLKHRVILHGTPTPRAGLPTAAPTSKTLPNERCKTPCVKGDAYRVILVNRSGSVIRAQWREALKAGQAGL